MNRKESYLENSLNLKKFNILKQDLKDHIVDYPDYPKPGIIFKDIWPAYSNPSIVSRASETLYKMSENFDFIVAVETRGFVLGAIISVISNKNLIPVRKKGKLPGPCFEYSYDLEYGSATLEIQKGCGIKPNSRVLIHDDILATGGTALAAGKLVEMLGGTVSNYVFLSTLLSCNGSDKIDKDLIIDLIQY